MPTDQIQTEFAYSTSSLFEGIKPRFLALSREYFGIWRLPLALVDTSGAVICRGEPPQPDCGSTEVRKRAVEESLRWGEPSMQLCPQGRVAWAVPVMLNAEVLGGIVAENVLVAPEESGRGALSAADVHRAALDLLSMAEGANLTNAALLNQRRRETRLESHRAEAIHELKEQIYRSIREIYLVEEPALISAVKRGDRRAAREILNRVLVGIYYFGRERPSLLKSFVLELVVTMSRSAVEAGADPSELLGANFSTFAELAGIDAEEALCAWLVSMLERIMDAIKSNQQYPSSVLLGAAIKYMQDNLHEELSRDDAANVACLSPSHFSRVVKQTFGQSFTELLARMRVEKARELLTCTEKSLIQVCLDCGFSDQSYFTKVFQRYTGHTPGEYRHAHRSSFK